MAVQMKQNEIPVKTIMGELGIKNKTQIETWWRWYPNDENHRLVQLGPQPNSRCSQSNSSI